MKKILITGGAGFIGSHVCVALANAGYDLLILDNFSNSNHDVLGRLSVLCKKELEVIEGDIRDRFLLTKVFNKYSIDAVIHCAGLKSVSESVTEPVKYYDNNVNGTIQLLAAMVEANVKKIVFSSSATVYGNPAKVPIREDSQRSAVNPYGRTKMQIEDMLEDLYKSNNDWSIACLRYFNPVGAHESGLIGEAPLGVPSNLMPYVSQVASGDLPYLNIWGGDYLTADGTGVRDYIHVCDLAEGHVAALNKLNNVNSIITVNLGTGVGYSVLDIVEKFELVSGRSIPYKIGPRRPGDVDSCWADPALSNKLLNWKAKRDLQTMCHDAWNWQNSVKKFIDC